MHYLHSSMLYGQHRLPGMRLASHRKADESSPAAFVLFFCSLSAERTGGSFGSSPGPVVGRKIDTLKIQTLISNEVRAAAPGK